MEEGHPVQNTPNVQRYKVTCVVEIGQCVACGLWPGLEWEEL